MRFAGYFLVGGIAFVALHALVVGTWHPRADATAELAPLQMTRAPSVAREATVLFAGDTAEIDWSEPMVLSRGFLYPFGSTLDLLRGADVAVANVEAPITDGGTKFPLYKDYSYRALPASAQALADAGFDVLGFANNHALDYGAAGLDDTLAHVARAGIAAIGAGRDAAEARRGVVVDVGGIRIGLLAYCERQLLWDVYLGQFARARHAGVAALAEPDLDRDVARLRARADLVVVSLHAGDNYAAPRASQLRWARRAVDAGADLVVEHHPHVAQPVAMYRGRAILLSLGNYAFGTPGRFERFHAADALDVGLFAIAHARRCDVGAAFDRVELVPLVVHNEQVRYRPEPESGDELHATLARLAKMSARYGALVSDENGRGVVTLAGCAVPR